MSRIAQPRSMLLHLAFAAVSAWAQPQVNAVTNGADYTPTIAPGSIATIFGTGLAPSQEYPSDLPLPTLLNGVSVTVNGRQAALFYVSDTQINFQVPFDTPGTVASLYVNNGGQQSNGFQCAVASSTLGIFQADAGYGAIQNPGLSQNSSTNPAPAGSVIVVYVTGIGPTDITVPNGMPAPGSPPARFAGTATATIGDVDAPIQFVGLTPGFVGLGQANIAIPDLPSGTYPMWISLNGIQSVSALVSVKGTGSGFPFTDLLKLVSGFSLPGVGPTEVPGISGVVDNSVAWFDDTLYICSPSDIKLVDVKNPAAPNFLSRIDDPQFHKSAHNCTVNSTAPKPFLVNLIRAGQSIAVFDITNSAAPVKTSQIGLTVVPRSVAYDGNTGFFGEDLFTPSGHQVIATHGHMMSVNFTNLSSPLIGPMVPVDASHPETTNTNLRPYMFIPAPGILYVASTTASNTFDQGTAALDIFDIGNPQNVKGIGQILVPGSKMLLTLAVTGTELLAVGDTSGFSPGNPSPLDFPFHGNVTLTMFDISDPRNPKMQGNVIVNSMYPGNVGGAISLGMVSLGKGFYAVTCAAPDLDATGGGGNNSLVIVDARDPQNPVAHTYGTISGLGGLTIANGYLYAAVGSGARIYQVKLP